MPPGAEVGMRKIVVSLSVSLDGSGRDRSGGGPLVAVRGPQPASVSGSRSPFSSGGGCSRPSIFSALSPVASIDFFTVAP